MCEKSNTYNPPYMVSFLPSHFLERRAGDRRIGEGKHRLASVLASPGRHIDLSDLIVRQMLRLCHAFAQWLTKSCTCCLG